MTGTEVFFLIVVPVVIVLLIVGAIYEARLDRTTRPFDWERD